jgi:tetratricopeptide (TPR) repeat protein
LVYVLSYLCGYQVTIDEYSSAVTTCQRAAMSTQDSSGAFDNLSAAHAALGDLSSAISDLNDAIGSFEADVSPDAQPSGVDGFGLASLYEEQGRLYVELGQPKSALADYRSAVKSLTSGAPDLKAQIQEDIKSAEKD